VSIHWSWLPQFYEFDTGLLLGGIEPYTNYHGVCGLMHSESRMNAVRPGKAFLNAEYYLRPGSGTQMLPRDLSREALVTHELGDERVTIRFPSEPEFGLDMSLTYRPHDDMVDMDVRIVPERDISRFDAFFASYVCEAFGETWVNLRTPGGGDEWTRLRNRGSVQRCGGVCGDDEMREKLDDGRFGDLYTNPQKSIVEDALFARPLLVARNARDGFALAFLCDPQFTTFVTADYHGWDTAHDWCFGSDLVAGREMHARARLIYRRFRAPQDMFEQVSQEFDRWSGESGQFETASTE